MDQNVPVIPEFPQENAEVDISMRHIGWMAGLVIVPLLLITFVIPLLKPAGTNIINNQPAVAPTPIPSLFATVISAKGIANLSRNDQAFPAVVNLAVLPKDTLETGPESGLGLLFDDGSILRLEENSKVQISEYTHQGDAWVIILDQLWGRTWNRVQKLTASSVYEVRTATAIASVRGTVFGVDSSNTNSAINVSEGTVVAKIVNKPTVVVQQNSTAPTPVPVITIKEVVVTAQQQVDIKKTDVDVIRQQVENKQLPTVAINARPIETAKIPEWVTRNTEEDKKMAPIFEKIRQEREKQVVEKKENKENKDTTREFIREIVKEIIPTPSPFPTPTSLGASPTIEMPTSPTIFATPTRIPTTNTPNSILANPTYAAYYEKMKNKISPTIKPTDTPQPSSTPKVETSANTSNTTSSTSGTAR